MLLDNYLPEGDRGQSYAIMVGGLMIILGAGVIILLDAAYLDLLAFSSNNVCESQACLDGVSNVTAGWTWFPLVIVGYFLIMVVAAAIFQSRSPQ